MYLNEKISVGIDIGGTRIKAALVDNEGRLSEEINEPSLATSEYSVFVHQLTDLVEKFKNIAGEEIAGVGLAVAGLMDAKRKKILHAPNCNGLEGRSLSSDISVQIGLPVVMDNDANAMALGEGLGGAARGSLHFIAFTLGTGVGGAVVSNGRLIRGIDGGGCELGHIPIDRRGATCGCGAKGCLEAYIGRAGIDRYIGRNHSQFKGTGLKKLSELAIAGDDDAADVFRFIGKTLGMAAAGLVNVFNPELVIIGGGIAASAELFLKNLKEEVHNRAFSSYRSSLKIRAAELGNWAGVVGAASLVKRQGSDIAEGMTRM